MTHPFRTVVPLLSRWFPRTDGTGRERDTRALGPPDSDQAGTAGSALSFRLWMTSSTIP
jgi:hypothetical protein